MKDRKPMIIHRRINEGIYIIGEIGLNHEGDPKKACDLVDAAKAAHFDAVKLQLRSPETFLKVFEAGSRDLGSEIVDHYIRKTFLPLETYRDIFLYAESRGIDCFFSAWDLKAADFAMEVQPNVLKVASAELNNYILMRRVRDYSPFLLVSTGMSTTRDIRDSAKFMERNSFSYAFLHCHSAYPSPPHHINLSFIDELLKICGGRIVGYSSHDVGLHISLAALGKGARIFEKHITLDKQGFGNDNAVSIEPPEMVEYSKSLREAFSALGKVEESCIRTLGPGEKSNRISLGKSVIANTAIPSGKKISEDLIDFYPSGEGLSPKQLEKLKSYKTIRSIQAGQMLSEQDFVAAAEISVVTCPQNCGIPLRYRDFNKLRQIIDTNYDEIHLSAGDLGFGCFESLNTGSVKGVGFHAPDIYEDNLIFDPLSTDEEIAKRSADGFKRVCQHIEAFLESTLRSIERVNVVTSFSSYSEHGHDSIKKRYDGIANFIHHMHRDYPFVRILPQTLPALAWYLGGQRYVNTFAHPKEIFDFCELYNSIDLCLDISHLAMSCEFYGLDFISSFEELKNYVIHFHLSSAEGVDDEGLPLYESNLATKELLISILDSCKSENKTAIVEPWHGHLNNGIGFVQDIKFLNSL